ncbi:RagB/SusD family nutrient uptake outer membrane protein [Dysgonomonas sp. 216]|uniref:RagB/SusD family nutrient uptake outer membrane protein n=1 Tax=Dysgonomonas sp. 216 TaxID=2302934 RepID=UPI0013D0C21B|nr:RagB/SusD family nutrient uptake outer membrane protein [Dysgonomonas sp. 216]
MKKYKFLIYVMAFLTCFSSCDYLDLEPEDGVTREKFWKTKEEAFSALMGCYAAMMNSNNMFRYVVWGEARAEMIKAHEVRGADWWNNIQNGEISSTTNMTQWGSIYTVINNCNTVLEYAKETQKRDESFSMSLLKEYEAEAVCIRALMYFYLVRTFDQVPYITDASIQDDQEYFIPKTPQAEILDYLIEDLKAVDRTQNGSEYGIPYSYKENEHTKGRFTVWSLKSLLADIYLWKGDYENCLKECNQIINSGQYSLLQIAKTEVETEDPATGNTVIVTYPVEGDADNYFVNMYANGNSEESIFELQFGTDYANPYYNMFGPDYGTCVANTDYLFFEAFPSSEIDRGWYDIRTQGVSYNQGLVWKWVGLGRNYDQVRERTESYSNWIFYRLSEIYLMKAEALNQLAKQDGDVGKLEQSLECVRIIRDRANAPESTDLFRNTTTIDVKVLEQFILAERGREFTHEGKRWFDLLRNAKRDNYASGNLDYLMTLAVYAAKPDKAISLQNKWKGDYNSHYLPINESEMRTNKALVQNPFYSK